MESKGRLPSPSRSRETNFLNLVLDFLNFGARGTCHTQTIGDLLTTKMPTLHRSGISSPISVVHSICMYVDVRQTFSKYAAPRAHASGLLVSPGVAPPPFAPRSARSRKSSSRYSSSSRNPSPSRSPLAMYCRSWSTDGSSHPSVRARCTPSSHSILHFAHPVASRLLRAASMSSQ